MTEDILDRFNEIFDSLTGPKEENEGVALITIGGPDERFAYRFKLDDTEVKPIYDGDSKEYAWEGLRENFE